MDIFIDSANVKEIERWVQEGVADGVTTNPSILSKEGVTHIESGVRRIIEVVGGRPVSVEVTTNDQNEMLQQARTFATWAPNIVVKIPVINEYGESCLGVIKTLHTEGIRVNVTAMLSFNQMVLAAKAGGTYLSLFAGRIADEGGDAWEIVAESVAWVERWRERYGGEILVGSIRSTIDIQHAAMAGAHIITIPPQFLPKMVDHQYSRATVRQFVTDAKKALSEMEKA